MNQALILQKNLSSIIKNINHMIVCLREQNYDSGLRYSNRINHGLSVLFEKLFQEMNYFNQDATVVDPNYCTQILQRILAAQEQQDYVLMVDLYEIQLYPLLIQLQQIINEREGIWFDEDKYLQGRKLIKEQNPGLDDLLEQHPIIDTFDNPRYILEPSYDGLRALAICQGDRTISFHSNNDISKESSYLSRAWYQEEVDEYIIFGLGLGYPIVELLSMDSSRSAQVYEPELEIIQLALAFGNLEEVLANGQLRINYDPDFQMLANKLGEQMEGKELLIFYPSLQVLSPSTMKEKLENYFVHRSSIENARGKLAGNFQRNLRNKDGFVDELRSQFQGRDIYIVAAGPSLDINFEQLKVVKKDSIILATGTVFKKLLNAGIRPDYVIVTDPNDRVYKQIKGVEEEQIPMLCLSTAFHGFTQKYQGKKYFICQKDYEKSEKLALEHGLHCFQTGGSVSTTALDIAIEFQCKRIIFTGLDLGYPNQLAHAKDTSRRDVLVTEGLRCIEDIHGKPMYTNKAMDMYRIWIENRIQVEKNIQFIDATEGGAKIKGMTIMSLKDAIQ